MKKLISTFILLIMSSTYSYSNQFYVGLDIAQVSVDTGVTNISSTLDEDDTLMKFTGGYNVDENVSIGSNCSIDKAKIDITYIGKNSMIDNLVHIAHNVIIGDNACIAAQTGIAGSVKIGRNLICGGQSAFAGHITIGDSVLVAGKSGVTKNLKDNSSVAGFPATDINKWKKSIILNRKKNV